MLIPATIGQEESTATLLKLMACAKLDYKDKDSVGALKCLDQATASDPTSRQAWTDKGDFLISADRYEEAIQCYAKVTQLYPDDWSAWQTLAGAYFDWAGNLTDNEQYAEANKRYDESSKTYDKAIPLVALDIESSLADITSDPAQVDLIKGGYMIDRADMWNRKGSALDHQKKYEEALKCYDMAISLYPAEDISSSISAGVNKCNLPAEQGKDNDSLACFDKTIAMFKPISASAYLWLNKGILLDRIGEEQNKESALVEALKCYDQAVELNKSGSSIFATMRNLLLKYHPELNESAKGSGK
jgi:tetratricopeptide (TPR) repeat protein